MSRFRSLAVPGHRDHAGFGAIDEMRHHAARTVSALRNRSRYPCGGLRDGRIDPAADRFGEAQAVAGIAHGRRAEVRAAIRRMREQLRAPFDIVRKAAAREHDAAPRANLDARAIALDERTGNASRFDDQLAGHGRAPHGNLQIEHRAIETAGQRVAIGQRHAAAVAQHVQRVAGQPARDIGKGLERTEHPHEVPDFLARAEHHPEHGQLGQRRRQLADVLAEFPSVERAGHHRTAAWAAARRFRVIVGKHGRHVELHGGVFRKKAHGLRAEAQERVDSPRVVVRSGFVSKISGGLARRLVDALRRRERRAGNP
jgi:hypothetical protein